jgi:hypothetical protein
MDLKEIGCEVMDWVHLAQVIVQWRNLKGRTTFET